MIDPKLLLDNPEMVRKNIKKRHKNINIDVVIDVIKSSNKLKKTIDDLKSEKNRLSKQYPIYKKEGKDINILKEKVKEINDKIKEKEQKFNELEEEKRQLLLKIPNLLLDSVPEGKNEDDNKVVRVEGELKKFDFTPLSHYDIGIKKNIIDFEGGVALSGTRFTLLKGKGSILHRALLNFMLNEQNKNGFEEIYPPFMVKREILEGTGQIPDKEEDLYKIEGEDLFLIPTAEVPLVNYTKQLDLTEEKLPIRLVGYSSCFRKEAGSYGKDIRGLIRVHQFDKVELVSITTPEKGVDELNFLLKSAELILKKLELPYRIVELSSGDTGFTAAITYDIEVYLPSQKRYREISSVSLCTDFQARRINLKYKNKDGKKRFVYTLNGSGLAVGRTLVAILENYQQADGSIIIPKILRPFTGFDKI